MADEPKLRIVYKKKKGGGGHHGGAWKVAYADFVTAMMALFIVLWLLATSSPQAKKDIARYFREPGLFKGGQTAMTPGPGGPKMIEPVLELKRPSTVRERDQLDPLQQAARSLAAELDRSLAADPLLAELRKQVQVTVTSEGILIQLIDRDNGPEMMFDLASAELKPALVALLRRLSVPLRRMENPLYVGGHTDSRAFVNSHRTNWDLSFERADNARRVFEQNGLGPRIKRVVAYGSSEPLMPNDPLAGQNRRLSILALRAVPAPSAPSAPQ